MSSEALVRLYAQVVDATFNQPDLRDPDSRKIVDVEAEYQVIESVGLPLESGIKTIENLRNLTLGKFCLKNRESLDTISLDEERAQRLAAAFSKLDTNHGTDCHDMLAAIQGWRTDRYTRNVSQGFLPSGDYLEPATAYAVMVKGNGKNGQYWKRAHDCIATDSGMLLSVLGLDSHLAIVDPETTLQMYGGGAPAYFTKAFSPDYAKQFPNGIVPADLLHTL